MDKSKITILVVDDDPNNLRVLSKILNIHGYKVQKAICGQLALNAAIAAPPDLILLDVMMPEINGYQLCLKLKSLEKTREIPVIFISVLDQANDKVKAFQAGGADYITKPFHVEEVLARIEHQLTIRSLQKKLQTQNYHLQQQIDARKKAEEKKDELISIVSHELRTPLACIRTALDLLATGHYGNLNAKGHQFLEIALGSTDRLLRLLNALLDLERIESGSDMTIREPCDIGELMQQAVESIETMAEGAGVKLAISSIPIRRYVNPDHIIQVLTNLLNNAIKFSPSGSTVWLISELEGVTAEEENKFSASANKYKNRDLIIKIQDQGRGIPTDKLESIFDRFKQVYASDAHQKGGSGLGLAICRSIVQQHGGRIWVESSLGNGSTFYFTLPNLVPDDIEMMEDYSSDLSDIEQMDGEENVVTSG